jgi:mannuronan synthase
MIGLMFLVLVLAALGLILPTSWWDGASPDFLLLIGAIGVWRYGWGLVHLVRSLIYRRLVFPRMRRHVESLGRAAQPSHAYLLITSFRISAETTERVYRGAIEEAIRSGLDCTLVASIVDIGDEWFIRRLFATYPATAKLRLMIVRIAGTGKRDALAEGFRAIARDRPPADAVACVIDGDSILEKGILRASLPFLRAYPQAGAFTTDEVCEVEGSRVFRDWYNMRFAQRHILMSSMGLARRVLTLTGRMAAFRIEVVCNPDFIAMVENDHVQHWRFGRLKFLTGDDKSTWYYLLKNGYQMLYIPDVRINTIESPPHPDFGIASTQLMMRWFGNMLRTNARALALGPRRVGAFTWWGILDQRMSMWTSLTGVTGALLLAVTGRPLFLLAYIYWVALSRLIQTLTLLTSRQKVSWTYPLLLYYNQVWGSAIKTYMLFHQDRQKWTRQKTVLKGDKNDREKVWISLGSRAGHYASVLLLLTAIGLYMGAFDLVTAARAIPY